MLDKEGPSQQQNPEDEPEGDLSAFERALADNASLDSEDVSQEKRSEKSIIRDTLEKLAAEYGFTYAIYDGRELGYILALNARLSDMLYYAPHSLSIEITDAIQMNAVTEAQSVEMIEKLTDVGEFDFKDEADLETYLYNIYQVLEVVVVDPQKLFESDLLSQERLTRTLQTVANSVQEYLVQKVERDKEQLTARAYLFEQLDKSMRQIRINLLNWRPELIEEAVKIYVDIQAQVEKIPEDLMESRGYLNEILKRNNEVAKIGLGEGSTIEVNEQIRDDVLTMISDL